MYVWYWASISNSYEFTHDDPTPPIQYKTHTDDTVPLAPSDHWPLTTDHCSWAVGRKRPPLCGGSAPATPPSYNLAPQRVCAQCEVAVPRRPAPPPTSWLVPNLSQRRQARRGNAQSAPTCPITRRGTPCGCPLQYAAPLRAPPWTQSS